MRGRKQANGKRLEENQISCKNLNLIYIQYKSHLDCNILLHSLLFHKKEVWYLHNWNHRNFLRMLIDHMLGHYKEYIIGY